MVKSFIGWTLATASVIIGVLLFFGVISFVPPQPLAAAISGLGTFFGWLFGTAAPTLGDIILDRLRSAGGGGATPPVTTVGP